LKIAHRPEVVTSLGFFMRSPNALVFLEDLDRPF
jgi:hypothetical protein